MPFDPAGGRRPRPSDEHRTGLLDEVMDLARRLRSELPALAKRARHGVRDGYPTSSIPEALGKGGHGDPVGNLAASNLEADAEGRPRDPLRAALDSADALVLGAVRSLREADSAVARTQPPRHEAGPGEEGCRLHVRAGKWRPIRAKAKGLCRPCDDFARRRGREPTSGEIRTFEETGRWPVVHVGVKRAA